MTDDQALVLLNDGLADLRRAFDAFDRDGDGRLSARELFAALVTMGQTASLDEADRLIRSVTTAAHLDFEAFVRLVEPRPEGLDGDADLAEAFALLDVDRDGYLSNAELRRAVVAADADPVEAATIVRAADADGDGRISFAEFRAFLAAAR